MQIIPIISREVEFVFTIRTDNNKKIIVFVTYRFPSENKFEFDSFLSNLEQLLRDISKCKLAVSVITGDFNERSSSW